MRTKNFFNQDAEAGRFYESEDNLVCIVSSRQTKDTLWNPCLNKERKHKEKD